MNKLFETPKSYDVRIRYFGDSTEFMSWDDILPMIMTFNNEQELCYWVSKMNGLYVKCVRYNKQYSPELHYVTPELGKL